jgi:hypothetical protein
VEKLKTPLMANAVYLLLLGLVTLSPNLVSSIFGYDVRDAGVLLVLSSVLLGFGVVVWTVSASPEKYGGLATSIVVGIAIGLVFLLYGWMQGIFTLRNVGLPIIIDVVLAGWLWSAKPK